ncbi:MAG: hypothetical protein H7Z37_08910 [Pyrinomonadaceae bacterium]|nr:hypothetical protein [Pyrinomonadaceae bacterium]
MNKRTEITIEIERQTIIRRVRAKDEKIICPHCGEIVEMLTTDEAALIAKCSSRIIFGWCEIGWLHFTETDEGLLLVCSLSLGKLLHI